MAGRDPWFDRPFGRLTVLSKVEGLTTLSEVEGESRQKENICSGSRLASRKAGLGRDDELGYNGVAGYPESIRNGFPW